MKDIICIFLYVNRLCQQFQTVSSNPPSLPNLEPLIELLYDLIVKKFAESLIRHQDRRLVGSHVNFAVSQSVHLEEERLSLPRSSLYPSMNKTSGYSASQFLSFA